MVGRMTFGDVPAQHLRLVQRAPQVDGAPRSENGTTAALVGPGPSGGPRWFVTTRQDLFPSFTREL
jgi:hypothetical protein